MSISVYHNPAELVRQRANRLFALYFGFYGGVCGRNIACGGLQWLSRRDERSAERMIEISADLLCDIAMTVQRD